MMEETQIVKKQTENSAEEYLGSTIKWEKKYYVSFGLYALTKGVFDGLEFIINLGTHESDYQLTKTLDTACEKKGRIDSKSHGIGLDIGLPSINY